MRGVRSQVRATMPLPDSSPLTSDSLKLKSLNLREAILEEHSKAQADKIAAYIGTDSERFDELMQLIFNDEYRVVQRATYSLKKVGDKYPNMILPYLEVMIPLLRKDEIHVAYRRNSLSIIAGIKIPEEHLGELADICFGFLESRKETIAVRANSMEILGRICEQEPELTNELKLLIEEFMPHESAGFKSRGKKILKRLKVL